MRPLTITATNFDQHPIPCVDLQDPNNRTYFSYCRDWIMNRFQEGLQIIKLDNSPTSFIEFLPAEFSWRGVMAPGYTFIHHLHIEKDDDKHSQRTLLLQVCEEKSRSSNGMVTVLDHTNYPDLYAFYIDKGYEEVGHLPGFVLMAKMFNAEAKPPIFALSMYDYEYQKSHDVIISYADQSEFIRYYIYQMKMEFERLGFPVKLIKLTSSLDARQSGSPYGTLGIFLDGQFLSHRLLNRVQIEELVGTLDLNEMYPETRFLYDRPLHESHF